MESPNLSAYRMKSTRYQMRGLCCETCDFKSVTREHCPRENEREHREAEPLVRVMAAISLIARLQDQSEKMRERQMTKSSQLEIIAAD